MPGRTWGLVYFLSDLGQGRADRWHTGRRQPPQHLQASTQAVTDHRHVEHTQREATPSQPPSVILRYQLVCRLAPSMA